MKIQKIFNNTIGFKSKFNTRKDYPKTSTKPLSNEINGTVSVSVKKCDLDGNKKTYSLSLTNARALAQAILNPMNNNKEINFEVEIEDNANTIENSDKISEISQKTVKEIPVFPTKPFEGNPTTEQRNEYVKSLLKVVDSSRVPMEERVRAMDEINEYGIDDLDKIAIYLTDDDELVKPALRILAKWGDKDYADSATLPFCSSATSLTSRNSVYIEALNTVQKLADLSEYTEKEREDIFYQPIRNLTKHLDKDVANLAKETLEKITVKSK